MTEPRWIRVASCDQIPPREGRLVTIGSWEIALFNLGNRYLATTNRCPHRGGPLCDGIVAGSTVVCPLHQWKVNLTTGAVERPTDVDACVTTYPTRVEDGVVAIRVPNDAGRASQGHAA